MEQNLIGFLAKLSPDQLNEIQAFASREESCGAEIKCTDILDGITAIKAVRAAQAALEPKKRGRKPRKAVEA